ncbi:MAG TPA: hypothetical protein VK868_16435 [Pyrinomonadaceae bacterium]|nr:hypothetical protein [Pyrinomonadaceae bacterium]
MAADSKDLSIGYGKVREININRQSRLLGILRLSDWVLALGCVFILVDILLEVVLASGGLAGLMRSGLGIPDDLVVQTLIVIAFLSIGAYTGWKHIGVIDARVWIAHLIVFGILALFFTLKIALELQNDFPTRPKEQGELLASWFWSGTIAIASLLFFVTVLMLRTTRIPALNISLVGLLARLKRKKEAMSVTTSRIKRVNTPLGILFVILGALLTVLAVLAYLGTPDDRLPHFRVILSLWGLAALLLLKSRGYFQVRADSLLSVDPREPILFLRSFEDDEKTKTVPPTKALIDFSLETRLSNHFRFFGPFIAVGSSEETVTTPGAARVVLSDSEWQDNVLNLIKKSALIVMYSGKTHWVNWELTKVIEAVRVTSLILLIPEVETEDIAARIAQLRIVFANTVWHSGLEKISNFQNVRALKFVSDGSVIIITSSRRNRDAYHLAALVAHYLILGKLVFVSKENVV